MRNWLLQLFLISLTTQAALSQGLNLTVKGYGLGIGNSRELNGIRLNFRDYGRVRVNGLNMTLWGPYEHSRVKVKGIALGLPMTGGETINGLAVGIFGAGAERSLNGIGIGVIGVGAGESASGLLIGGIGAGTGGDISGVGFGGVGLGAGGNLTGIMFGGIGVGAGGSAKGIFVGGIGVGSGGAIEGLSAGIIGVGSGGEMKGLSLAGVGVGAGGDMAGIFVTGVGIGCGGELKGIAVSGVGIGAPKITGLTISLAAGSEDFKGIALAPAYFKITERGIFDGIAVSAFSHIQGEQKGLTIGIVNFAEYLDGLQIGLINIAKNNPGILKVLPVLNANFN